jgi:hypothetical protein
MNAAVLTGDIIRSRELNPERRAGLQNALEAAFVAVQQLVPSFRAAQYRGDSFQAIVVPEEGLKALLLLQSLLHIENFGVRIALGLGDMTFDSGNILTSDGSAFQLSGPALDELKKKIVSINGPNMNFNEEWKVHALTLDYLLQRWTLPQAEAVLGQLRGLTQEETARLLHVRQPAVQQRLQSAGWSVMEAILERFVSSVHALVF